MPLPYENASSGRTAMDDIRKVIITFGCSKFAPMEDFTTGTVSIQFEYRGRMVQVSASAKGYADLWMREHPHSNRMKRSAKEHAAFAMERGQIAVWSILRDWIKGQFTAVECGLLDFEEAFLGQIVLASGKTLYSKAKDDNLLPPPEGK